MDTLWSALIAVVCLIAGFAIGWVLRARTAPTDPIAERRVADMQAALAASDARGEALREHADRQEDQLRIAADAARRERDEQRDRERREAAVLSALSPVQETLQQMHRSVSALERDRQSQYGAISEQLRRAQESDESLRTATESLAGALRSTTARGTWGEAQLRRIVETAGLTRHVDFDLQVQITDDDGATGRPDLVVWLPGGKALAVDAKAPLDAFLRASTREPQDQASAMLAHAKALRSHVDALAKRAYWTGLASSPEFVVCFVPSEAMLSAALEADATLLDHAFAQRVALASPVSLWSVLRTVAYTWTQQEVSEQAHELFRLGNQLYERLGTLAGHAGDLRQALERTVASYNKFAASLETRVLVTARRFPGIDEGRLQSLTPPADITTSARGLSAAEFSDAALPREDATASSAGASSGVGTHDEAPVSTRSTGADVGDLRERISGDH